MPLNGDEPRETNDVAAEVIAEIEGSGADTSEPVREITDTKTDDKPAGEKKVEGEKKPDAKADDKKVEDDDDDFDNVAAEIDDPNPRNKGKKIENRLPHSRVKRMVERAKKAAREAADAEWKGKHDPLEETLNGVLAEIRRIDALMGEGDGTAFLAEIAKAHPQYKDFVRQVKAEIKAAEKAAEDPEPEPDVANEKGEMVGYSIKQAKALMRWTARQEAREAAEGVRRDLEPVKATVEGAQKSAAERAAQQRRDDADYDAAKTEYADALENWPGMKEHEAEVQAAFRANPKFRLHDAYMAVVIPKLQKQATDARTAVLEELKKEPITSTTVARAADTETTPDETAGKPKATEDIARQVMREMGAL